MFEKTLAKLSKFLKEQSIPYMIIGGQAVLLYGEPRLTKDIDITLGIDVGQAQKILNTMDKIHLKPLPEKILEFINKTFVLPTEETTEKIRIDFIFSTTDYEKAAIKRSVRIKIRDQYVNFAAIEDLIIHKIFSGRPKDIEDIKAVLLKNSDVNKKYITNWLKKFSIALNKNFVEQFENLLKDMN